MNMPISRANFLPALLCGASSIPAKWLAFAGKQKTWVVNNALQLREYLAGYEILAHARDGIGLEAMILRGGRMGHEHRRGDSDGCSHQRLFGYGPNAMREFCGSPKAWLR
jgi:hypothetical protein